MSLFLDVSVTGLGGLERVDGFKVTNRGHPGDCDCLADSDNYLVMEFCDRRDYEWSYVTKDAAFDVRGYVQHRRGDGALKLVQIVLNSMLGDKTYVH